MGKDERSEGGRLAGYIKEAELLKRFGLSENQLRYLRSEKGLPYLNLNKRIRLYKESDLIEYLEGCSVDK
jgi:hypothetical protein